MEMDYAVLKMLSYFMIGLFLLNDGITRAWPSADCHYDVALLVPKCFYYSVSSGLAASRKLSMNRVRQRLCTPS